MFTDKVKQLQQEILEKLEEISQDKERSNKNKQELLKTLELKYLSRKGEFSQLLKELKDVPAEQKQEAGKMANEAKQEIWKKYQEVQEKVGANSKEYVDITLPGYSKDKGHLNPMTILEQELEDIFGKLGFKILEGPELESDYYNFTALNFGKSHPARDSEDTFYVRTKDRSEDPDILMRTHTSPVQARTLEKHGAPFRGIVPGRVFRNEAIDASHEHTFHQLEGLMVDEDISISNLVAVMKECLKGIFQKEVEVRIRPGYFPFVEPGFELDIKCLLCEGKGCSVCKYDGWVELFPAGMVHPNVLKAGGVDPEKYSGFAFGLGTTRLAMMLYGIDDIRLFNSGDLRFLEQY